MWAKAFARTVPGQPVFGDLRRWNGVDPPSPDYGAGSMEARAGGAVHRLALEWSGVEPA